PGGERHLAQRGEQAAVAAVVIGQQQAVRAQRLYGREEGRETFCRHVRRALADRAIYLRQRRAAEAVGAIAEIDQQQFGFHTFVQPQLRRERAAHILHRRKRGHDQRQRRDDLLVFAVLVPGGAHGQRILAHRNRQPRV